jgi:hypothetical protein
MMHRAGVLTLAVVMLASGCRERHATPAAELRNEAAALPGGLPYPVLTWRPLTSSVDRGARTTSTLFGNEAALAAANADQSYSDGAVLGLVTWRQREDAHWFGGRIPDAPLRVEFVSFAGGKARLRSFAGTPLTEAPAADVARTEQIAAMRPVWRP